MVFMSLILQLTYILCNDISFIFADIPMFIAKKKEIELHPLEINLVTVPIIELPFVHPWFFCEILELEEGNNDSKVLTPKIVPNIEKLTALAFSNKILNTYLISPGYMNNSKRWALNRLINITRAEYFAEGCSSFVYRFELENGNLLDYDSCGLNKNRNDLCFETILNLAEVLN